MRTLIAVTALLGIGTFLLVYGTAYTVDVAVAEREPVYAVDDAAPLPVLTAPAWGVFDVQTGELVLSQDAHASYPIASVTKLMTAVTALALLDQHATTTLSHRAIATEARTGRLQVGDTLTIHELLFPLLIESSNDAAEALAEHDDRAAFIAAMNGSAGQLGMQRTRYADPSGLSPENVSSVEDIARLMSYIVSRQPHLLDITRLEQYIGTVETWRNNDPVAYLDAFQGGKHGYTPEANRTLAALFEEKLRTGQTRPLAIVLLGSDNLIADTEALRTFIQTHVAYQ